MTTLEANKMIKVVSDLTKIITHAQKEHKKLIDNTNKELQKLSNRLRKEATKEKAKKAIK